MNNSQIFVAAVKLTSGLLEARSSGLFTELRADLDALIAKSKSKIGPKADGSDWTDADILTLSMAIDATLDQIDAQHQA